MRHRSLVPASVVAVVLSVMVATVAFADTIGRDADPATDGIQASLHLGNVAPGAVIDVPIDFWVDCTTLQHLDQGQSVVVEIDDTTHGSDGTASMVPVTLGPPSVTWAADGEGCGTEAPRTGSGTVKITAPSTEGDYDYVVLFKTTPTPDGDNDLNAFSNVTGVTYMLTVVSNTPPVLVLPSDMTVDADTPGGWTAAWTVSAIDAEDDPDPTPTCSSNVGDVLPLGATTVECSVMDSGGLEAGGSFVVTVVEPPVGAPAGTPTAVFGPPIKEDGLDGHAGRTIPMKVRLMLGDVSIGEGSLVLVVTSCAGGDAVAELEMDWRDGSQRWFGHLRTRGWEPGCYDVRAMHDGIDVGGTELRLTGKGPKATDAKHEAKAAEKAAAKADKAEAKGPKGAQP